MTTASEADIKSRWADTTMQGYQQIVAVSQGSINRSLKFLWDADLDPGVEYEYDSSSIPAEETPPKLKEFTVEVHGEGKMVATISAPTVKLLPNQDSKDGPPVVLFSLHFQTGTYDWWTGHGKESQQHVCEMKDWKITFQVNLSLTNLEMGDVPEHVRSQILVTGSYSIDQLLVDFGCADLTKLLMSESLLPGIELDEGKPPKPVSAMTLIQKKEALGGFISKYIAQLALEGKTILGYAVTVPPSDAEKATFKPTLVKFQAMHYRDPSQPDSVPTSSDSDIFIFLEMTDKEKPKFPDESLRWTGNWVTPGSGGTLSVCSYNIWQGYLLPLLQPFNSSALNLLSRLAIFFRHEGKPPANESYNWAFDHKDYLPVLQCPAESTLIWTVNDKPEAYGASFKMASFSWKIFWVGTGFSQRTSLSTDVSFEPSKGELKFEVKMYFENQTSTGVNSPVHEVKANLHLVYHIVLSSVSTGEMNVTVDRPDPVVALTSDTYALFFSWGNNGLRDRVKADLDASPIMKKDELATKIAEALNGQKHFVFPGGGTFDMKNPIFNNEGDLLVDLTYKPTKLIRKADKKEAKA